MPNFDRLRKTWKVRTANDSEIVGHKIRIDGGAGEDQVTVTCLQDQQHRYANGTYHANPDRIDSELYTITLTQEGTPNVITCVLKGEISGSWTADDSLPSED